jgi:hypothetical protein
VERKGIGWITEVIEIWSYVPSLRACVLKGRHLHLNIKSGVSLCCLTVCVVLVATVSSQKKLTPLHWAAVGGHAEVAKVLLAAGANVHASDKVSRKFSFLWRQ